MSALDVVEQMKSKNKKVVVPMTPPTVTVPRQRLSFLAHDLLAMDTSMTTAATTTPASSSSDSRRSSFFRSRTSLNESSSSSSSSSSSRTADAAGASGASRTTALDTGSSVATRPVSTEAPADAGAGGSVAAIAAASTRPSSHSGALVWAINGR